MKPKLERFKIEIAEVISAAGLDEQIGIADIVLAEYVANCLGALNQANKESINSDSED